MTFLLLTLAFAATTTAPSTQPTDGQRLVANVRRSVRVHDPSNVISCNGEYRVLSTGSGIRAYRSRDLAKWELDPPRGRLLDQLPAWTQKYTKGDRAWAPDVIRAKDGRYFVYYSASSWGKNASAIGLISSPTLDPTDAKYKWTDEGPVIVSSSDDDFNAIDPAVTYDAEGKMWLSFGSFWSGIRLIELDSRTGKRIAPNSPIHLLAHTKEIEAPFILHREGGYYLFVNWGLCCRGVRSTYNIRVGRADRITGPYLDKDGRNMRDGGGTLVLGSKDPFIGPGHASIFTVSGRDYMSCHFYDATQDGRGTLAIVPIKWTDDGWPEVGEAVKQ